MGPRREIIDFGFNDAFNLFEKMFNNIEGFWCMDDSKPIYSCAPFPPTDVYVKENKDLVFKFAVAGYGEDAIKLDFNDDYMVMKIEKEEKEEKEKHYLRKGIKYSKVEERYYVPSMKYDRDNVEASLRDGILTVMIPAREEAKPKTIKIDKG